MSGGSDRRADGLEIRSLEIPLDSSKVAYQRKAKLRGKLLVAAALIGSLCTAYFLFWSR